ncbi:MAG: type 2 lanthipeptide synthetase LanM family protein [Hyalangium sp.]|uniref:type 2 lanthipeptide synthetase LanM family protein n=1 Tax=Hyalangium sp. TaxID=2028555 RepID=UPI00389A8F57
MSQSQPRLAWYQALTLAERIASLRAHPDSSGPVDMERAQRRLKRWREKPPLSDERLFTLRLSSLGITQDELLRLLGEPVEALRARVPVPPRWMLEVEEALSRPLSGPALPYPPEVQRDPNARLLIAAEPFLRQGLERLQVGMTELASTAGAVPFEPETAGALLFASLPSEVLAMITRTLALELHVARLEEKLQGETPQERFQSFVQRLESREALEALHLEYPLLARQLVTKVGLWVDNSLEFLRRLCADWEDIRRVLSPGQEPGKLAAARASMGDVHRRGHSVMSVRFSSGFKLVYKPRSLATDVHFQALLEWVNAHGPKTPFQLTRRVDRPGYGWVEFVEAATCTSEDQVRRFYRRQGGYLALLYVLEGADFHFENIIAAGEHPVLVDLESLLHPTLRVADPVLKGQREAELFDSVLRIGMLPQRAWEDQRFAGVDISGLGNPEGNSGRRQAPAMEGAGTDQVFFTRRPGRFRRGLNLPTLNGADVELLQYHEAVVEGFSELYTLLLGKREELLGEHGPLRGLVDAEVRVLLRPTFIYKAMLIECNHPDLLRNALDRDRFLERLWLYQDRLPYVTQVSHAERQAIERGDVPLFSTYPNSTSVWGEPGEEIANVFPETGLQRMLKRVARLSQADLERQTWLIRASFTTLAMNAEPLRLAGYTPEEPRRPATRERLLEAARAVGDRLEALAVRDGQACSWFGVSLGWDRRWRLMPLGLDLYGGLPGVALFLAWLGELTGQARYTELAQGAVRTMGQKHEDPRSQLAAVGGFLGWGGTSYVYTQLGKLWKRPDLLDRAETCIPLLEALIPQDDSFDVLGGSAGAILALAALHRGVPSGRAVAAARRCGEQLLAHAKKQEHGLGWVSRIEPNAALTGFSHGAAGIACALLEVGALTGEARFHEAAHEALSYERSLFSAEKGNWPDLRGSKETPQYKSSWCHGSTGIGLARLASLRHKDDAQVRQEIAVALADTRAVGLGRDHSLCHGDLGSLELLLAAREAQGQSGPDAELERWTGIVLDSIERHGWLSGAPLGVETPGFMVGLAGIGYELLRLAEPGRVPSVVVLGSLP